MRNSSVKYGLPSMDAHDFERQRNLATCFNGSLENISIRRSTGIIGFVYSLSSVEECVVDLDMVRLSSGTSGFRIFMIRALESLLG